MEQLLQRVRTCLVTVSLTSLAVLLGFTDVVGSTFEIHLHEPFGVHQILGCHLLHWSGEHLFWDVAMFAVLGVIVESSDRRTFCATLVTSAIAIPLCIAATNPNVDVYRGLSGIDTALFSLLATRVLLRSLADSDQLLAWVFGGLLLLLGCKIGFEFITGQVVFVQQVDFVPLPVAHAVGALVGMLQATVGLWAPPIQLSRPR